MRVTVPILFLLFSCSSGPAPKWVISQPKAQGYWIGKGMVKKPFYGDNIREEARSQALSEIAQQISVDISATFKNVVIEHNLSLDEMTESITKIRVENTLMLVENVDEYEGKEYYYFLARLSQSAYYKAIEKQRRNAVKTALGLLNKAESEFNIQSFSFLVEAMNEISPYMEIPIQEEYPSGSGKFINLYSYIKLLTNNFIDRLHLVPTQKSIEYKLGFSREVQLGIQVLNDDNSPITNAPVHCYIHENMKSLNALSDAEGNCIFPLPLIDNDKPIQHINFSLDIDEILQGSELFGNLPQIHAQSTVKVIPPKIFIQITENNLGNPMVNPYIQPVIVEFFSRHFSANFVDNNNADLIINGAVNTRSTSDTANDYGIYQVFGDATISISNGVTGEKILEKSFNRIQGSNFQSNTEAANQSLKKMSEKISIDFLPEIIDLIKGK